MSQLGMPLMVMNLGGEMMYILEQRLVAQKIQPDKARKVIGDIVRTMYNPKFIQELFKPQDLYSSTSTRQIFERIAHSSIMRLSESSMDKLYDLMTTGFKYQIISCQSGAELMDVTQNHLNSLRNSISADVIPLLDSASKLTHRTYGSLTPGSMALLRQTLLRNLQDKRVKVSPFLLDGIQNTDSSMVLQIAGGLPPGVQVPGQVRFILESGESQVVHYPLALSDVCVPYDAMRSSILGLNLYLKSQHRDKSAAGKPHGGGDAGGVSGSRSSEAPENAYAGKTTTAGAELSLLSKLLGVDDMRKDAKDDAFKLSIFDDPVAASAGGAAPGSAPAVPQGKLVATMHINRPTGRSQALKDVAREMDDLPHDRKGGAGGGAAGDDEEDDLLALMDSAI